MESKTSIFVTGQQRLLREGFSHMLSWMGYEVSGLSSTNFSVSDQPPSGLPQLILIATSAENRNEPETIFVVTKNISICASGHHYAQ